jgi:hypothetical protein
MVKMNPDQQEPVKTIKNEQGIVIDKIYNPSVGRYDVRVVTGPGYATKRQQSLDAMVELLQGNPQLWAMAGDLFVKNMDWPGAQELAKRLGKAIDPKLLQDDDENPELQQAQMQIEQLTEQFNQAQQMLQNIGQSMEAKELSIKEFEARIKAYDAETKRIQATSAGMTLEQIQDIVQGTIDGAVHAGDLIAQLPEPPQSPPPEMTPSQQMQPPPQEPMPMGGEVPQPAPGGF